VQKIKIKIHIKIFLLHHSISISAQVLFYIVGHMVQLQLIILFIQSPP